MTAEEALALILRDTERSCGRSLLLSLFIASSIQQGGTSEPGVQPGQTWGAEGGASAKQGGEGNREGWRSGGRWCTCVSVRVCETDDATAVEGARVRWDGVRVCAFLFLNSGSFSDTRGEL